MYTRVTQCYYRQLSADNEPCGDIVTVTAGTRCKVIQERYSARFKDTTEVLISVQTGIFTTGYAWTPIAYITDRPPARST